MMQLVLSLFPGIGLLDRAFEEAGFCVVRGPDPIFGGDIHDFTVPPGRFDGIIGGPPCQAFSRLRHIVEANGYQTAPNLIPQFERVISEAQPKWFLMENVVDAPPPHVSRYGIKREIVRDAWVGGITDRMRAFTFGQIGVTRPQFQIDTLALHRADPEPSALASGGDRPVPVTLTGSRKRSKTAALSNMGYKNAAQLGDHLRRQGLPPDFLADSPLTVAGKIKVVGNGVPLAMGRAVATAVARATMLQTVINQPSRETQTQGQDDGQHTGKAVH